MTPESVQSRSVQFDEMGELRSLLEQQQARVRELESAQAQLEIYADDLQRTFRELRRQLSNMNELHKISTIIGSVLEPTEVMARTLDGLGRLVEHDLACIYLLEEGIAVRRVTRGKASPAPPDSARQGEGMVGRALLEGAEATVSNDGRSLAVPMRAGGAVVGALLLVRGRDSTAALADDDRKLAELVAAEAAAAIQNARLYEQTRRLATTDPQTGLFNLRYFRDALTMEVARARRLGYVVGLLMIDVDNFKRVNDTYGHPIGDEVLRDVAVILKRNLRRTDVVVRYGGEEFSVILPGLGPAGVRAVAEKLCRAVRSQAPLERDGKTAMPITVSIGGSAQAARVVDSVALVREADAALYDAKRAGKDCAVIYSASVPPVSDPRTSNPPNGGTPLPTLGAEGEQS